MELSQFPTPAKKGKRKGSLYFLIEARAFPTTKQSAISRTDLFTYNVALFSFIIKLFTDLPPVNEKSSGANFLRRNIK